MLIQALMVTIRKSGLMNTCGNLVYLRKNLLIPTQSTVFTMNQIELFTGTPSLHEKQLLAITAKIKKGKAKNPDAAKQKIRSLEIRQRLNNWLGQ